MSAVTVGQRVRVVKGRSAPIGTEGVVFWAKVQRYGRLPGGKHWARVTTRLGLDVDGQRDETGRVLSPVYTYSDNVEVLGLATDEETSGLVADMAKRWGEEHAAGARGMSEYCCGGIDGVPF